MAQVVDPRPLVEARLRELATLFEPRLDALHREIAQATGPERRLLKRRLSEFTREYRDARRTASAMLHAPVAW